MAQLNTRLILRNDSTANWLLNEEQILLKGEVGIEFLEDGTPKVKIGDGVTPWKDLGYFGEDRETQVYQFSLEENQTHEGAIAVGTAGKEVVAGDIAIIKELIAGEGDEAKYMHTAYVYNGTAWAAMDGNYNAKNVFFDQDFTFTKAIGTVTIPSSGSKEVAAAGKNLYDFFAGLFAAEDTEPDISSQPSVSACTLGKTGNYEAGTQLTGITYSASFEDGKYQYGPEPTGVTVSAWEIKGSDGVVVGTTASGSVPDMTISENTNYTITAKATYGAGSYAKTNLGNESTVRIAAGNKTKTSSAIKGYRNTFYGTLTNKTADLTASVIRGLTKSGATLGAGSSFTIDVNKDCLRTVLAVPATLAANCNISVAHREGLGAPQLDENTKKVTVSVPGANNLQAIDYTVYYWDYANPYSATEHYDVTITAK